MFGDEDDPEPGDKVPDLTTKYTEPDPENRWDDPAEGLVDVPKAPTPGDTDVPGKLALTFWGLVLVFNVAVLAVSLGLLFYFIAGRAELGGSLLFVGGILGLYGGFRYWTSPYRDGHPDADTDTDGPDDSPET